MAKTIGIIGLGKLGMPFAFACAMAGYKVIGYDMRPEARRLRPSEWEHEAGIDKFQTMADAIEGSPDACLNLTFAFDVEDVARRSDVVFVAVQTPHDPRYGGHVPPPDDPADFDYRYVESVLSQLVKALSGVDRKTAIALISTVLPGTHEARFKDILGAVPFYYVPQFIAMGTVLPDFTRSQEPILVGRPANEQDVALKPQDVLRDLRLMGGGCRDFAFMSVASAEVSKITYNTWISAKIGLTNNIAMVCEALDDADAGDVCNFLKRCNQRITGPTYMTPGMGDGGGCHPRDNIAMRHFTLHRDLPLHVSSDVMEWRDAHAFALASTLRALAQKHGLKVVQLGTSFKANHPSEEGSHAKLVMHYLGDALKSYHDPVVRKFYAKMFDASELPTGPAVMFHAVDHDCFRKPFKIAPGSVFFTVHPDFDAQWVKDQGIPVIVYGGANG